jgi:long-chain acyl-CoA synthetase
VINRGGFKIQPDDVVHALQQHPAVLEAAVVGIPDLRLGETPAAAIILAAGCAEPAVKELRAFLTEKLLPYQIPTAFLFVGELPRTPSLKPSLPQVRRLFAGAEAGA